MNSKSIWRTQAGARRQGTQAWGCASATYIRTHLMLPTCRARYYKVLSGNNNGAALGVEVMSMLTDKQGLLAHQPGSCWITVFALREKRDSFGFEEYEHVGNGLSMSYPGL